MRTRGKTTEAPLGCVFHKRALLKSPITFIRTVSSSAKRLGLVVSLLASVGAGQTPVRSEAPARQRTWEPVGLSGGGAMFSPAISPADPNLMMLNCDMSAAYLSEDGGRNWRMIHHAQLQSDTRCRPGFHPANRDVIYASSGGRLRISRDRGLTFVPIGDLKESLEGEIAINPCNPDILLAGTRAGRCASSRDGGVTWTPCQGPEGQVIGFHFDRTTQGRVMFTATDKGIWRSDDEGQNWADKTEGLPWKEIQGFVGGSHTADNLIVLYCTVQSTRPRRGIKCQ